MQKHERSVGPSSPPASRRRQGSRERRGESIVLHVHTVCIPKLPSVSVSVETRRSDDLYTGASPDGDGVEAERWPLLGGDGGRKEMGRGRLEVLVDNAWRTHVGRRGGEGCYDTYRSVLYGDPRASPWPFRVTGVSYARARQRPGGLTVSPHARFGTASGGGRKCGEKRRGVGRRAAPRTAG